MDRKVKDYIMQPILTGILFVLFSLYLIFKAPYFDVGFFFYLIQMTLCFLSGLFLAMGARLFTDLFFKEDKK